MNGLVGSSPTSSAKECDDSAIRMLKHAMVVRVVNCAWPHIPQWRIMLSGGSGCFENSAILKNGLGSDSSILRHKECVYE